MKKKIIIAIGLLILIFGYLYIEAKFLKPDYIGVRKEKITDESIPDSFNNFEIVFFSDLTYDDETDLNKIATKINNLNPDIIIFGGDAVSQSSYLYNQDTVIEITNFFKSLKVNYTKYAVLGEKDNSSEFVKDTMNQIFADSGFEVLDNRAVKFRINTTDYINIVGLEDYVSGSLALSSAFSNIKPDTYTLVATHSPDIFTELTGTKTNLCLSGHSLGGLANIPLYGPIHKIDGAARYYNGTYSLKGMKLDVSDGVNAGKDNLRFFTNNEIVSYKIKKNIVETKEENLEEINNSYTLPEKKEDETPSYTIPEEPAITPEKDNIEKEETHTPSSAIENVFD